MPLRAIISVHQRAPTDQGHQASDSFHRPTHFPTISFIALPLPDGAGASFGKGIPFRVAAATDQHQRRLARMKQARCPANDSAPAWTRPRARRRPARPASCCYANAGAMQAAKPSQPDTNRSPTETATRSRVLKACSRQINWSLPLTIELSINQDVHKGSRCLAGLASCHPALAVGHPALAVCHPALAVCHPGLDPGSSGTPTLDCGSWPAMTTRGPQ